MTRLLAHQGGRLPGEQGVVVTPCSERRGSLDCTWSAWQKRKRQGLQVSDNLSSLNAVRSADLTWEQLNGHTH